MLRQMWCVMWKLVTGMNDNTYVINKDYFHMNEILSSSTRAEMGPGSDTHKHNSTYTIIIMTQNENRTVFLKQYFNTKYHSKIPICKYGLLIMKYFLPVNKPFASI